MLIKYTYYGDANLDGKVNASDYSLIDNGYLNHLTGWFNGDFNYDGVVNGSDYTLIDNAFNMQGALLAAVATTQIAGDISVVPEPSGLAFAGLGCAAVFAEGEKVRQMAAHHRGPEKRRKTSNCISRVRKPRSSNFSKPGLPRPQQQIPRPALQTRRVLTSKFDVGCSMFDVRIELKANIEHRTLNIQHRTERSVEARLAV